MKDLLYAIIVFFIFMFILISLTQTHYKADEERLIRDYPNWIVVHKTDNWLEGKQMKIVHPDDRRTGVDDLENYDDFRCYEILFNKYEVGDTLK